MALREEVPRQRPANLEGASAAATGTAKGIGRTNAELLVANGCSATTGGANPANVPGAAWVRVDITNPTQVTSAEHSLRGERVDVLVNDAGGLGRANDFTAHARPDWRRIIEVHLVGTLRVAQAIVPTMA